MSRAVVRESHSLCMSRAVIARRADGRAIMYGPRSLRTVEVEHRMVQGGYPYAATGIGYMAKTSNTATFVTFEMASNGYFTWHSPVASPGNVL